MIQDKVFNDTGIRRGHFITDKARHKPRGVDM